MSVYNPTQAWVEAVLVCSNAILAAAILLSFLETGIRGGSLLTNGTDI